MILIPGIYSNDLTPYLADELAQEQERGKKVRNPSGRGTRGTQEAPVELRSWSEIENLQSFYAIYSLSGTQKVNIFLKSNLMHGPLWGIFIQGKNIFFH